MAINTSHPKLENPLINYEYLARHHGWWACDSVICTLGSTRKQAGSKKAFYRIDHDYPLMVAQIAKDYGATAFALNSAAGAKASSWFFYNRVKGQLEQDLAKLQYESLTLVRPGLIGGERQEFRLAERIGLAVLSFLEDWLPASWRISQPEYIAQALLEAALHGEKGVHSVNSAALAND